MRYLTFALGKGRLANQTLELFEKIGYERQPEVIELFDLITQTAKEML